MEKKLSNNLGLKVLSVFLAFFVWLAVMNIANPKVTRSQEVPLEILNESILEFLLHKRKSHGQSVS